ncbi:hypothetical protein, partial [Aurantiacibacter flavus]
PNSKADSDRFPDFHRGSRLSVKNGDLRKAPVKTASAASVEPFRRRLGFGQHAFRIITSFLRKTLTGKENFFDFLL